MLSVPDPTRFEQAQGELGSNEPTRAEQAVCAELASGNIELGRLWQLLIAGRLKIVGTRSVGDRSFAELVPTIGEQAGPLPRPLDRLLFERVLGGECPKVLAGEVGVSVSYLSTRCATILARIGCEGSISRTSPLVAMAVLAARGVGLEAARVESLTRDGSPRWLVSVTNPAASLRGLLTRGEYEVAQSSIDGRSLCETAAIRGTTQRTVANQLASIFRKLNVSGRGALRALAIRARENAPGKADLDVECFLSE